MKDIRLIFTKLNNTILNNNKQYLKFSFTLSRYQIFLVLSYYIIHPNNIQTIKDFTKSLKSMELKLTDVNGTEVNGTEVMELKSMKLKSMELK